MEVEKASLLYNAQWIENIFECKQTADFFELEANYFQSS